MPAADRRAVRQENPLNLEFPLTFLRTGAWITPVDLFYVRTHFPSPRLSPETWRLVIDGEVERPLRLTVADLARLPRRALTVTLECAGNRRTEFTPTPAGVPWQAGAVSTAEWEGIPLREVLGAARPHPDACEVVLEGADRGPRPGVEGDVPFARSIPIAKALAPETLLADRMNGAPLPPEHGFPLRALVAGWYGMDSVKWLVRIHVTREPFRGVFQADDYQLVYPDPPGRAPIPLHAMTVQSVIGWPAPGERLPWGGVRICGAAWAGEARVTRVLVSAAPAGAAPAAWHEATFVGPDAPAYAWRLWEFRWRPPHAGRYELRVRAEDSAGRVQPDEVPWNLKGYGRNAVMRVPVEVAEP